MTEYKINNATVRIHHGRMSEEEFQAAVEKSTQKFLKSAMKQLRSKKKAVKADG